MRPRVIGADIKEKTIMATDQMEESWARIKTQIQTFWGEFDEKEMKKARGDLRKMVSLIREKTGEDEAAIIQKIGTIV